MIIVEIHTICYRMAAVKDLGRPSDPTHPGKAPSCALYSLAFPVAPGPLKMCACNLDLASSF